MTLERLKVEFIVQERERWYLDHSLKIDRKAKIKMEPYLENFKSPQLQLCYKEVHRPGFSYKMWFVKDSLSRWVINFNEEPDDKYLVKVHEYKDEDLQIDKDFEKKDSIIERMTSTGVAKVAKECFPGCEIFSGKLRHKR